MNTVAEQTTDLL